MIIDVNVSLGAWPFREFSIDSPEKLNQHLTLLGITQAWVRSCRAAFLTDPANDNEQLIQQLEPYSKLIAIPTVNPMLSQANIEEIKIINLYPGFHRYKVNSTEVCALAERLVEKQGTLLITMRMEDARGMHPDCIIPNVPIDEVVTLAKKYPKLNIICLNSTIFEMEKLLNQASNIYCDMAYTEMGDTIKNLTEKVPDSQIVFGSHTPFYTTGAQLMKIKCSETAESVKNKIMELNVR
jgi:uncharacterized protein